MTPPSSRDAAVNNTAQFAVATITRWWTAVGAAAYPGATALLISADGGGSNGSRNRLFKTELAALAARTGLTITVCHLPPGTSKWNKIEHRLFSHISMNWRGRPLTSHDVIVQTIAATTTRTGLTVHAELDTTIYPTGVKIPDDQMRALETTGILVRHDFHGEWNYTLNPAQSDTLDTSEIKESQALNAAKRPLTHVSIDLVPRMWTFRLRERGKKSRATSRRVALVRYFVGPTWRSSRAVPVARLRGHMGPASNRSTMTITSGSGTACPMTLIMPAGKASIVTKVQGTVSVSRACQGRS